jgi:hypothetical protein
MNALMTPSNGIVTDSCVAEDTDSNIAEVVKHEITKRYIIPFVGNKDIGNGALTERTQK